jgi:predicted transcriptional regulator
VYDYTAGKVDWLVRRRAVEGTRASEPTVGDLSRDDAITCRLSDRTAQVGERVTGSAYPFALVLSEGRVLLGRVATDVLEAHPDQSVEEVMEPGPSTVRPHKTAAGVADDLRHRDLRWGIVTTPEGELIGVVSRAELEAAVREPG